MDPFLPKEQERYTFEGELGRGGMGRVYAVRDHDLRRVVALKVLHADHHPRGVIPEDIGRFVQEAQIAGQLEHPNIIPVHELGCTSDGQIYFTMKRISGQSLAEILFRLRHHDTKAEARYPLPELLRVVVRVCDAVAYAHARGVVHRDIKPDNILVGPFGEVLLMDWGLATAIPLPTDGTLGAATGATPRPVAASLLGSEEAPCDRVHVPTQDRHLTQWGFVVGTPAYLPPEATEATTPVDSLADIYALGCVLYEILTLTPPYEGEDPLSVVKSVSTGAPPPPRQRTPSRSIPRELEAVVGRAMARSPGERYPSANALQQDLQNWLENRPVSVYRDWLPRALWRWSTRHPGAAVAIVATLLLTITATVLSLWAYRSAQDRSEALQDRLTAERQTRQAQAAALEAERAAVNMERELRRLREAEYRREQVYRLTSEVPQDLSALPPDAVEGVLRLCNRILGLDPDHVTTRVDRARLRLRLGDVDGAEADLRHALTLAPTSEGACVLMASLLQAKERPLEGLGYLEPAIARNPIAPELQIRRLALLAQAGRFQDIQTAITDMAERFPLTRAQLAKLRVRYYERERRPDVPRAASTRLGADMLLAGRYEDAAPLLRQAVTTDPESTEAHYNLAAALSRLEQADRALDALERAFSLGLAECPWPVLSLDDDLAILRTDPRYQALLEDDREPNGGD